MLTDRQLREIAEKERPKYIYFDNIRKGDIIDDGYEGFSSDRDVQVLECTACMQKWEEDGIKHKHKGTALCPCCGNLELAYNRAYGRKSFKIRMNAVIIYAEAYDSVYAECVKFTAEDFTDIYAPDIFADRRAKYHFTPSGAVKYNGSGKLLKSETGYAFYVNHMTAMCRAEEYNVFTAGEINPLTDTFLKYSCFNLYPDDELYGGTLAYLMKYCKYPALCELLIKTGNTAALVDICESKEKIPRKINRYAKTVKELLPKLPKAKITAFINYLKNVENESISTIGSTLDFLHANPVEKLLKVIECCPEGTGIMCRVINKTGQSPVTLANYLKKQKAAIGVYSDYIKQCRVLRYDLSDTGVLYPKSLKDKHSELSEIVRYSVSEAAEEKSRKRAERLKGGGAEYRHGRLAVVVPEDAYEIISEGAKLGHCVGGCAESHSNGKTTILFIRKRSDIGTPFFTLEIDIKNGKIIQCYGYKNRVSYKQNLEVGQFLEHYRRHLEYCRKNKTKARKSA